MSEDRNSRTDGMERRRQQRSVRKKKHQQKQAIVFGSLLAVLIVLIVLLLHSCGTEEPVKEQEQTVTETEPEVASSQATLIAVGDNLLHQQILNYCKGSDGYDFSPLFADLKEEILAADIACLCQETILVNEEADTSNNITCYGTISALADDVQAAGFDVVAQATEHAYDKTMKGIQNTAIKWAELGVECLGIHAKEEDPERYVDVDGIRIALLDYTYYTVDTVKPENAFAVDYLGDDEKMDVAADIARAKQNSDIVIVFAHWGQIGDYEPNDFQNTWAKFFADNGVGAVIGSHSHVLQPVDQIARADGSVMPVYYSLGNYMTHMSDYYNMLGGMAKLTITKDSHGTYVSGYELIPLVEHISQNADGTFAFRTLKLEDYRAELAATHQFPKASVANMVELWQTLPGAEGTAPISREAAAPDRTVPYRDWSQTDDTEQTQETT